MLVNANAKINLSLDIIGKRDDGFHDIDTVMQSIDLSDKITISKNKTGEIKLTCAKIMLPTDEKNIAYRAAKKILERGNITDMGVDIHIIKEIPIQAGLGGGSADAAAVLKGINKLFDIGLDTDELIEIGASIGADVPFCIVGGTKRCTGIGEVITDVKNLPNCKILICKPNIGVDTTKAYTIWDQYPQEDGFSGDDMVESLESNDIETISSSVQNYFDYVLNLGEVNLIKSIMKEKGALCASMSGSGSAVFGVFEEDKDIENLTKELNSFGFCKICHPTIHTNKISTH
ncbi:MAG: 4-(cytidine 5'-diphospho)-2-C-methyl-D-erythritol kinase [Clostridia bacterium]